MYHLLVISAYILQYNHNDILTGHFGQNKTLKLICYSYFWPSLYTDIQQFCKFYVTCMQYKLQHYKFLKQLHISK